MTGLLGEPERVQNRERMRETGGTPALANGMLAVFVSIAVFATLFAGWALVFRGASAGAH